MHVSIVCVLLDRLASILVLQFSFPFLVCDPDVWLHALQENHVPFNNNLKAAIISQVLVKKTL